jgi:hypothetical protein
MECGMSTERSDNPPGYASAGEFERYLNILSKVRLDSIDNKKLMINGFSVNNAAALISTLKFLGLYDENGTSTNPKLLIRLGASQERQNALREIVDVAYQDLISSTDLERATVKSIDLYFQLQGVKPSIAGKAARLFVWIAQQAGYKLGEEFKPSSRPRRSQIPKQANNKQSIQNEEAPNEEIIEQPESEDENVQSEWDRLRLEAVRVTIENMRKSGVVPQPDLLRELNDLLNSGEGRNLTDSS